MGEHSCCHSSKRRQVLRTCALPRLTTLTYEQSAILLLVVLWIHSNDGNTLHDYKTTCTYSRILVLTQSRCIGMWLYIQNCAHYTPRRLKLLQVSLPLIQSRLFGQSVHLNSSFKIGRKRKWSVLDLLLS